MRFVVGYAGLPSAVYDGVYARRARICGDNGEFISEPLRSKDRFVQYTESHANFFLKYFAGKIRNDHQNVLKDTGFILIYVKHEVNNTAAFVQRFFPSTLCVGIPWNFDQSTNTTIRQSKNRLIELLKVASDRAKLAIPPLKKEITERDSRTPLLLPVKNFESKQLVDEIESLQELLMDASNKQEAVSIAVELLEHHHPLHTPQTGFGRFFVDDRNVEFRPPGSNRHGYARGGEDHPDQCLLSGRRRLGAPFDRAFHYDCLRGAGNIRDLFYGCHEDREMREGKPHLNIAPNDNVR